MSTRTKTVLAFLPSADFVASEPGGRDTVSRQGGAFAENGDRPGTDSAFARSMVTSAAESSAVLRSFKNA